MCLLLSACNSVRQLATWIQFLSQIHQYDNLLKLYMGLVLGRGKITKTMALYYHVRKYQFGRKCFPQIFYVFPSPNSLGLDAKFMIKQGAVILLQWRRLTLLPYSHKATSPMITTVLDYLLWTPPDNISLATQQSKMHANNNASKVRIFQCSIPNYFKHFAQNSLL